MQIRPPLRGRHRPGLPKPNRGSGNSGQTICLLRSDVQTQVNNLKRSSQLIAPARPARRRPPVCARRRPPTHADKVQTELKCNLKCTPEDLQHCQPALPTHTLSHTIFVPTTIPPSSTCDQSGRLRRQPASAASRCQDLTCALSDAGRRSVQSCCFRSFCGRHLPACGPPDFACIRGPRCPHRTHVIMCEQCVSHPALVSDRPGLPLSA